MHLTHFVRKPPRLTLPSGHFTHSFLSLFRTEPFLHFSQFPLLFSKKPFLQSLPGTRHAGAPHFEVVPGGHFLQWKSKRLPPALKAKVANVPALHFLHPVAKVAGEDTMPGGQSTHSPVLSSTNLPSSHDAQSVPYPPGGHLLQLSTLLDPTGPERGNSH